MLFSYFSLHSSISFGLCWSYVSVLFCIYITTDALKCSWKCIRLTHTSLFPNIFRFKFPHIFCSAFCVVAVPKICTKFWQSRFAVILWVFFVFSSLSWHGTSHFLVLGFFKHLLIVLCTHLSSVRSRCYPQDVLRNVNVGFYLFRLI